MKTIRNLAVLFLTLLPVKSLAEISFSYSYNFKPESLQKLYDGLVEAQNRDSESQDLIASIPLFDGSTRLPLQGICLPHKPDTEGTGCTVSASQNPRPANGQLTVSIRKSVEMKILKTKLNEISAAISSTDPNTAQGHLNFGNVLYNAASDSKGSSDYFCAAEGVVGSKTWQCYLSVGERL